VRTVVKFKDLTRSEIDAYVSAGESMDKAGAYAVQGVGSYLVEQLQGIKRWPCPQFWKRVTISPDGSIRFCVVDWLDKSVLGHIRTHSIKELWDSAEYERLRGCHIGGKYGEAHSICGPCTDWMGMRWEWGFEVAVGAVMGNRGAPSAPPPLA
jgi:MoaA/NifB/PqqE/SkfB family radical SAM enzyme